MKTDYFRTMIDCLVKSRKPVIPAKAGIQKILKLLDSRFRGNDKKMAKSTFYKNFFIYSLCFCLVFQPVLAQAGTVQIPGFAGPSVTPPAAATLPVWKPGTFTPGILNIETPSSTSMVIHQNQPKAIIDWQSFNISSDSSVHFDQQGNTSWAALNRIWNQDPSLIFGKLTADGKIYLINQNGILFGPGSQVNVNTLVASALNMTNDNFLNNSLYKYGLKSLVFQLENYQGTGLNTLATVSNQGEIISDKGAGGSIFLIAPRVDNAGLISTPLGQTGLVAGTNVTLAKSDFGYYYVVVGDDFNNPVSPDASFGRAVNLEGGELRADGGRAGMYGNNVDQWGIIRSVTAFQNKQGLVELRAANKVTTGEKSVIMLPVDASIDPETGKIVTVNDSFNIQPMVNIQGLYQWNNNGGVISNASAKQIELEGKIAAPTGNVSLNASGRVYLGQDSLIDVSGVKYMVNLKDGASLGVNSYRPSDVIETSVKDAALPASALSIKLNSVELRDAYGQKGGVLQGTKITTTSESGSAIGDLNALILTQERTALERSIGGARRTVITAATGDVTYNNSQTGAIKIQSAGDIIFKQGAKLDVSGGSIRYESGSYTPTRLVSGMKVYDIASAPLNIKYDRILGSYTKTYERYGVRENYAGYYYGNSSYVEGYTRGGDAGTINLTAPFVILDGVINGGVTPGVYQTAWTMPGSYTGNDFDVAMALSVRRGLETPRAGSLTIDTSLNSNDSSIAVVVATTPSMDILPDTPVNTKTTEISAQIINNAKLGALNLATNNIISTAADAQILLAAGGTFSAKANRIEHSGKIKVNSGQISLNLDRNIVTSLLNTEKKIILGSDSLLDVSGERIDNSLAGKNGVALQYGQTTGGKILIQDSTFYGEGVDIQTGAVIDVSGGYTISQQGAITGGHAGILDIQGSGINLDGDLRGWALADTSGKILGGSLTLRTDDDVMVVPSASAENFSKTLVIADDQFADTGFTQITLNSRQNVFAEEGVNLMTSLTRLKNPTPALQSQNSASSTASNDAVSNRPELIRLAASESYMAGPSNFTLQAAQSFSGAGSAITDLGYSHTVDSSSSDKKVVVSSGAEIRTARAVASVTRVANDGAASVTTGITLGGPYVEMNGKLESRGGNITLEAKNTTDGSVTLSSDARIDARGYNRPDPSSTPKGFALNSLPVAGGAVKLTAAGSGNIILAAGSEIDVSGDGVVENRMKTSDGKTYAFREAGDPGSLTLSYGGELTWAGTVKANNPYADDAGIKVQGGTLTVNQTQNNLNIGVEDIQRYKGAGFDDITLKALGAIQFTGVIDADTGKIGRKLTLGARQITGAGQDVNLSAPWIVLTNHNAIAGSLPTATSNTGELKLTAENGWIDLTGDVNIGGFTKVTLTAGQDIRLNQAKYNDNTKPFRGLLAASGDLTLDANRIYPGSLYDYTGSVTDYSGTYSDFTVSSVNKITVQSSSGLTASPVYSAGGSLTLTAVKGIEVQDGGYLAAPLGKITLSSPGQRIYLAEGSTLSTASTDDLFVKYGFFDINNNWLAFTNVKNNTTAAVSLDTFAKSVTLDAGTGEVIVREGATMDVSGGGGVSNFIFQPGVHGSTDPLRKSGRYIVFKDNSFAMPGSTVHLKGVAGFAEDDYTIIALNAQTAKYAFLPGAYILETQKGAVLPMSGLQALTKEGYPLIYGYAGVEGTSIQGTRPQIYSVRTAAEIIKTEGDYLNPSLVSGNSGDITISGKTSIIEGTFNAQPWTNDYAGGKIALSAGNIFVQKDVGNLFSNDFSFLTPIADDYKNNLYLSFDSLSDKGFREVSLGDEIKTSTVMIEGGTESVPTKLTAAIISLAAKDKITISPYASLYAQTSANETSGEGKVSLATTGTLLIDENAEVRATHLISLDVNDVQDIKGNLTVDSSAIELKSANIYFGEADSSNSGGATGLHVTDDVLNNFSGFENITFTGKSDIQFWGDTTLFAPESLTLDAAGILDMKTSGASAVTITAPVVNIRNTQLASQASTTPKQTNKGTFTVNADDKKDDSGKVIVPGQINIGGGDVSFGGFSTINLNTTNDLAWKGKGSLTTGNADLNITAARVITAAGQSSAKGYIAPGFVVDAGTGAIMMTANGATPATTTVAGGLLEMTGNSISLATVLRSDAGTIKLTSTGASTDGIFLNDGGGIIAQGTADAPGGQVTLSAVNGSIALNSGSEINVDAGTQGDTGAVTLLAPTGGVTIDGTLSGKANGGDGGSVTIDTDSITDFASLNEKLATGGFTESIDVRTRTGDFTIAAGTTVQARQVILTTDGNDINVSGKIDATGASGGRVELYAQNDVNVNAGSMIDAHATQAGGRGGDVLLSAATGSVDVKAADAQIPLSVAGKINVSGGENGTGGTLYLRAQRNSTNDDVNIDIAQGSITGARAVYAEAVKSYAVSDTNAWTIMQNAIDEANNFYDDFANRFSAVTNFHLLPGIELYNNAGNINWNTEWDQDNGNGVRFGNEPGVLTIRAKGDLNINKKLVDHPTDIYSLTSSPERDSWAFNLIAGADLSSADYLAVNTNGTGNLTIANSQVVYTESAPIRFASGNDTKLGSGTSAGYMISDNTFNGMKYSIATYDGDIRGYTGRDLIINGGAIQSATGDIDITAVRDVQLNKSGNILGAIRTTGETRATEIFTDPAEEISLEPIEQYWRYEKGGNITLFAGRHVGMLSSDGINFQLAASNNWDTYTKITVQSSRTYGIFSANYEKGTAGIATMGGGNVFIRSGGDFLTQAGAFGAGGWYDYNATTDADRFKGGNIAVYAGGDINGRFLNMNGLGEIHAQGNFGEYVLNDTSRQNPIQIELFNSRMNVTAPGEMQIAAIVNPSLVDPGNINKNIVTNLYTQDTSIQLKAGADVTLAGQSTLYASTANKNYLKILPAAVDIKAGGDILLGSDFILAPSPTGNLSLIAGGDVRGVNSKGVDEAHKIKVSDVDPSYIYGKFTTTNVFSSDLVFYNKHGYYMDSDKQSASKPLHYTDSMPILISAGGNISNLNMTFPKKAEVSAYGDILNITYQGQNLHGGDTPDVSKITAGGNISMAYVTKISSETDQSKDGVLQGLIQGGPGVFMVSAGKSIDLGMLQDGIQTIGNGLYPQLGTGESSLIILSGYSFNKTADDVRAFFAAVQKAGDDYAQLSSKGKLDDAAALLAQTRQETITPFLGEPSGEGNINMISSQIGTSIGKSDIFIIASGDLNLGKTSLPVSGKIPKKTGITTGGGGAINILSAQGDINVNESRIMTFFSRDDVRKQVEYLNLGLLKETVVSKLLAAKQNADSQALEEFLQSGEAATLSQYQKDQLVDVKKKVVALGDITAWADRGNINAGRGSRTAVSADPPKVNDDGTQTFSPPAIGSGIRAATYGDNAPPQGNVHLFAPQGVIDAGEAEISGGKITMAAQTVVNVQNIVSTSGTVGVSGTTASTASLGSLSGAGSVAQNSQLLSSASGLGAAGAANAAQMIDDVMTQWLDVKVIDFIINDNEAPNDNG